MQEQSAMSSSTISFSPSSSSYFTFKSVTFHWSRSVQYGPHYREKNSDANALALNIDTRKWLPSGNTSNSGMKKGSRSRGKGDGVYAAAAEYDEIESPFYYVQGGRGSAGEVLVELYIGHFTDTRMVLLFATTTVQQLAQTLFERGLTSRLLPLPLAVSRSDMDKIESIERCEARTSDELRDIQKRVDRQNKKVTHEENMTRWGEEYEEIRRLWRSREESPTFIGLDVETYEFRHSEMLEIGWSVVSPSSNKQSEWSTFHYIVEDAFMEGLRNGRHVADNRRKFLFGLVRDRPLVGRFPNWTRNGTEIASTLDAGRHFMKMIRQARRSGPVFITFHDARGDLQVMEDFGIDTLDWSHFFLKKKKGTSSTTKGGSKRGDENSEGSSSSAIANLDEDPRVSQLIDDDDRARERSDQRPLHPVYIVDTQKLFSAIRCGGTGQQKSLKKVCVALNVNDGVLESFHNAANDAYYTVAALVKMAEGPHFTVMRESAEKRLAAEEEMQKQQAAPKGRKPSQGGTWD